MIRKNVNNTSKEKVSDDIHKKILFHYFVLIIGKILSWIPDKIYIQIFYFLRTKKRLNLKNPVTFNEKLHWLNLYYRNPDYVKLSDKFEVRSHITNTIGEEYLIPLLGVWDSFDDIDFDKLPNQFVLKCTHDSGSVIICKDKSTLNIANVGKYLKIRLKRNFYYKGREWQYNKIKPRIIAEKYMEEYSCGEIKDYKFFCFNGEPKLIQVDFDRFKGHKRNLYSTKWEYIPASIKYPTHPEIKIEKPKKFDAMLNLAKKLSSGYPHVRVDLYSIDNSIFFGELTFSHGNGCEKFTPKAFGIEMGSWMQRKICPICPIKVKKDLI